jgi:hypothetical protein
MSDLVKRLRDWCENIRRKPAPISDAIPMVQQAADRIQALEAALRQARSCAYPVSTEIDPRGHRWSEAYLDQLLPAINDLLKD